ncbi:hypothetical protein SAMN02910289_01964 [Lachnospiraceae bacterium RM5]|nr:hypothetical protein SAMN02910289_01964 [Lachnospiraceae bacterium RM5]
MKESFCVLAVDFCKDYSQIAYCNETMSEPDSVSTKLGDQLYLIPTAVGYIADEDRWCIGEEAISYKKLDNESVCTDMLDAILTETGITLSEKKYSAHEVVTEYFKGLLNLVEKLYQIKEIDKIVVSVEYPDRILVNLIRNILGDLGFLKDNIKIIGHSESLIYYTIFQKKELWVNDVLVFDFNENQFFVRRLTTHRARTPQPVIVEENDLSKKFKMEYLSDPEKKKEMDKEFLVLIKRLCEKYVVSTVYLTGKGFYENWMEESIRFLCLRRRVFQGYNLFVKGGAYAAISMLGIEKENEYQFVCAGRTVIDILLEVDKEDKDVFVTLSKAGTNWYEAGARAEVILDDVDKIRLKLVSSLSKSEKYLTIDLNNFPQRPNRTTRVEIILAYRNDTQCIVVAKDMGFGEFFKATDSSVKTTINIEEYI